MGPNYKTFLSVIYEFAYYARVSVRVGWKSLAGRNTVTVANYENL
jgi:hypothetical protein